jgi:SNF2 family DNA or RNA helicase
VEVDKTHERATYKAISWLIERVRNVEGHFTNWQQVESHVESTAQDRCERCAPISPNLAWVKNSKNKIVALEDSIQAGEYERRLKGRPAPFVTQLKFDESHGIGTLRIAINIPSLLHRALSRLPNIEGNGRIQKAPTLSWRLNTEFSPAAQIHLPKFTLLSNKKDKEHKQPPHFKLPLRVEQLRSLEWMIKQESSEVEPFTEEEISEAIITSLGWRAEGRVQREVFVRGGVLADQVGYGKTAITLALVDCTQKLIGKEVAKRDEIYGKVITKATLIIVPPHLTRQWGSEVKKFTGASAFKTVVVSTMSDWNRQTIETITEADVVIVASNLLKSEAYLDSLSALSTAGDLPKTAGRYMETCLDKIGEGLKKQVERLRTKGASAVLKEIEAGRRRGL